MEAEKINSIYTLFRSDEFRKLPAKFIGRFSILGLRTYIEGYRGALLTYNIEEENNIFNYAEFNDFVAARFERTAESGWQKNIWVEYYGNEYQSFKIFFSLFDEFIGEKKEEEYYDGLLSSYISLIGKIA